MGETVSMSAVIICSLTLSTCAIVLESAALGSSFCIIISVCQKINQSINQFNFYSRTLKALKYTGTVK